MDKSHKKYNTFYDEIAQQQKLRPRQHEILMDNHQRLSKKSVQIRGQNQQKRVLIRCKSQQRVQTKSRPIKSKIQDSQKIETKDHFKELISFQNCRTVISRIVESKIKSIQQELIPCPFCALALNLSELDHISNCKEGTQCIYCKEKYPKDLLISHRIICLQRDNQFKKDKRVQHKFPIFKRPIEIAKNSLEEKPQKQRPFKKDQYNLHKEKWKKQEQQIKEKLSYLISQKKLASKDRNIKENRKPKTIKIEDHPEIKPEAIKIESHPEIKPKISKVQMDQYNPRELDLKSQIKKSERRGLLNQQIERLQLNFYFRNCQIIEECSICTTNFSQGEVILELSCSHIFHRECLTPWLQNKSQCPICKSIVKP